MRSRSFLYSLSALTLVAPLARAQGFGPDTSAAAIPADSGGAVVIAPQNNGTTQYLPANPGEGQVTAGSHSVVVTNQPAGGTPGGASSIGSNAILPDEEQGEFAESVPDIHLVRRGDTLWDLCNHYYQNPWAWPKVWSYNPQVANPHWIYPGDQLRLTNPNEPGASALASKRPGSSTIGGQGAFTARRPLVPKDTIFLRDQGFIGDPKRDVWGELIGSDEEQMMLAEGNHVVLIFRPGVTVTRGQDLTIFNGIRQPQDVPGARKPPGEIVAVRGTVRILEFNPDTRMAKGVLTESVDVIERGAKVGPIGRRFDVVPPRKTQAKVATRILTSIYPNVYIAQQQIAFLDKGSEDGLLPGSRLFVLRKGDSWRASLTTGSPMTSSRALINSPEEAAAEDTPKDGDEHKFPEESVAELRVLRTEKYSAIAIVTQAQREVVSGDLAVTRPGQ